MPTNILRKSVPRGAIQRKSVAGIERLAVLRVGRADPIRLRFTGTETANRIWMALPLYGIAETWGECIHFEIPFRTGRDRTAKINGSAGEIYFWGEDARIVIPFGPTPISREHEMRLPRPCNVWAEALDDVRGLLGVVPGEKVSLIAVATEA